MIIPLADVSIKRMTAGVDEAGRGPLAGSVVAAAVILDASCPIAGLADSKKLSEKKRDRLSDEIKEKALAWSITHVNHIDIDRLNILRATMLAMEKAVLALSVKPDLVLVDGNKCPNLECESEAIVKGDQKVPEISAASILAKVSRDEEMYRMDQIFPGYGFAKHKGYPTKQHIDALQKLGVCEIHRKTYAPVQRYS